MVKPQYILLFVFLALLFSNQTHGFLNIKSSNDNQTKLIFELNEKQFQHSFRNQPKSSSGLPLYTFILETSHDLNINLDYSIMKITDLDYNDHNQILIEGISKKEEQNKNNIKPVFISKQIFKNNKKYIALSVCPINKMQNILYSEIEIQLSNIDPQFKIIGINQAAEILSRNSGENLNPVLLIIAPNGENIYNLMTPFINWKKQKGYKVFYKTLNDTGYSNIEIKSFIQSAYDNWEYRPNYICIIGDADGPYAVPTFNESLSNYNGEGDHPYTLLEGYDDISDVAIGRLSIRSLSDLANISNKVLNYEQSPLINTTDWFKRGLCVGDPSVSGMSTIITNQIIAELMLANDFNEVMEVYQFPFVNQIENGINSGVSFYNYRGFAGSSGWQKDDADNLSNGYMLPIVSIITCDTGSFLEDEESTAENFLRAGSISIPKGGIAAIGMATQGTHTMFNNCLDYGLYHGIFVENISALGDVLNFAKNNLWLNYPENPNNYVEIFSHWINLMGDPTLSVWTNTPESLSSNFTSSVSFGQTFLDVEIYSNSELVDNALITITDENYNLISSSLTQNGVASLDISSANLGTYNIAVTKQNYIPLISDFEIVQAQHSINVNNLTILDQNLSPNINPSDYVQFNFSVFNYGYNSISNLIGEIIFDDDDIIIENNTFNIFSELESNSESQLITIGGLIQSDIFKKEINGMIHINAENQNWSIPISLVINGIEIIPEFLNLPTQLHASSGFHNVVLQLENIGYASTPMIIELNSNSELLNINNSVIEIPQIANNEIIQIEEFIQFEISYNSYPGLQIPITLTYSINGIPLKSDIYTIELGQINSHSPLGPDQYGYYIYDNSDIIYQDVPIYDWIEIDPALSGNGTILINLDDNGDNQDDVTFVNVPFEFQFYGESYEQISISTNGWIQPGLTNQSSFRNWRIPGAGGPSPIIAAFWDDLRTDNGRICVDYDVENNWYIIEWSSVRNGFDLSEETFQVIIFDKNYYPSITGDNIIKIQYKVFNNVNAGHYDPFNQWHGNFASIGIENHDSNMGLEYTWNNQYPNTGYELQNESAILITTNTPQYLHAIIGDVNFDESIDILDIVLVIQSIISNLNSVEIEIIGDVNFDESLNVLDVVALINIILQS